MAGKRAAKNNNGEQLSLYDYQLKEVRVRLVLNEESALYSSTPLKTPQDAVNVMGDLLRGSDREMVCIIATDSKLKPLSYNVVSIGGVSSAMVPIANCFKTALLSNGSGVILLHSHPSGDTTPSQEDFEVTKRFVQAGKLLDIPALDHVIIGAYHGEQFSFRGNYPDMFYAEPDLSVFPEMDTSKGWHVGESQSVHEASVNKAGEKKQIPADHVWEGRVREDPGKKSVIERLSEKKEQVAVMDRAAPSKKEYSL